MKRLLALALLVLVVVAVVLFFGRGEEIIQSLPGKAASPEEIKRGLYLAQAGDCLACHTVRGGQEFAGGLTIPTPFGALYTPNITPDEETGIGKYSANDFWRALHEGRGKNGDLLYPAFPYTNYTKVTREDSDAMYAYFMSLEPVRQPNKPHELRFPYNNRQLLVGWRALYFSVGVYEENPKQSKEWNRGAYLVEGLGHCNACHSTRNILGATQADDIAGGLIPVQNWYAPALTSSRQTGLGDWEIEDVVELLRTGVSPRGAVFGPMAAVVHHSLQFMTEADLRAMAVYMKSQKQEGEPGDPPQIRPTDEQVEAMMKGGKKVYEKHCADCHGDRGQGVPRIYPPLVNNEAITMRYPINAVRMVLVGGFPPSTQGNPRPYGMPPFAQDLSDEQVAAAVTYIRQSWGNNAPPVAPAEIASARGVPAD
ncbi:MAG: c-type cytochrome [Burkholderiales bacterium]